MPQFRRTGVGSGSGSGATPAATPTPVPAAPTTASVITQAVTFSITAAQFSTVQTSLNQGYGRYLGIYVSNAYVTGASVSSTAPSSRRALAVTFTANVPATHI